ncbi:Oidioi.mRNA.OKI2018_I69.PAR.g8639.t1.cds [Oikopleura dioica]|uniref:Sulfotransferase n=1 Tax=Oikopleura dioica TaxID=34765 RepID=A0ABN7RGX9_OIKDI|nr:Oidioi.mRNA.OKI2018_I69.PAR.g8639.t1.cds [Oikopleura dioica]
MKENRFDLIFNTHQNWKDTRYIQHTYNYFGLDFSTYNDTEKVDLIGPKEDFQREISEQFLKFDNIDCVMLKQPFGIIDWVSPPSDYNFLKNLTSHIVEYYPEAEIIEEQEISDFAKSRLTDAYFDTQLSLLSQELAFTSDFFFYSNPSTWSANVVLERLAADKFGEEMILDFEMPDEDNCDLGTRLGRKDEFDVFPLVSFAGSGNTWTRMLLEKSTGIYTGSIYNDKSLYEDGLFGEYTDPTDGTTLFQKAHNIDDKNISSAKGYLFLIRNPFDAVIAEFKRRKGKGHTSSVSESVFKEDDWIKQGTQFLGWWHNLMLKIISKKKENKVPMHIFFYEDLKINATREMAKILDFVESQKYYAVPDRERRLQCLEKSLKETEKFHRPKAPPSFEYFSNAMIEKGNQLINEVYDLFEDNELPKFEKKRYLRTKTLEE